MRWLERLRADWSWSHPGWGLAIGAWIAFGDIALTPPSAAANYTYVATTNFAAIATGTATALAIALAGWLRWRQKGHLIAIGVGLLVALVGVVGAAVAVPDIYNSYDMPAARFAILPIIAGTVAILAGAMWFFDRQPQAEILLVAGVTAATLVPFVQEAPLVGGAVVGLALTYLWLWPEMAPFSRNTGLALHMLALLGFLQQRPEWFEWNPFPFLTFVPIYIIAQYLRSTDQPKRVAWWTGFAVAGGSLLLGLSTLLGNLRRGLPPWEPIIMFVGGGLFMLLLLWLTRRDGHPFTLPFLGRPVS